MKPSVEKLRELTHKIRFECDQLVKEVNQSEEISETNKRDIRKNIVHAYSFAWSIDEKVDNVMTKIQE